MAARPRRPGAPRPDPSRSRCTAATSCARPATRRSSCATSTPRSTGSRAKHASDEYRAVEADGDHAAQELRGHRLVHRRGPSARARPARLLEPARVQHVPQPPAARLGAPRRPRARVRRGPRPQPRDGRVLRGRPAAAADLLRAARRLRPRRGDGRRGDRRWARPRCSSRRAARRATRRATSRSTRCGRRRRRRASRSCSTSAAPATSSTPTTSTTACRSRPTSTAARRTSARSTTWASPARPTQTLATMIFDGVLERFPELRIGVIEQGAIWVPSWMRQMESAFEAFDRHEERLQALSMRPTRVRAPPGPLHAVPDRGRRLDHRAGRARGRACSRPTTRTSRAAGSRSSGSRRRSATRPTTCAARFYCDNFLDLMGTAGAALI